MNERTGAEILVVDDEPGIASLLQALLTGDGQQVTLARDGQEALDRVAERQPDLVLLDLDMPHLGGFEVCDRLKHDPATRLLPILILTGQSASEARLHAWELGADDFLSKPFQVVELLARCRSLLASSGWSMNSTRPRRWCSPSLGRWRPRARIPRGTPSG